MRGVFFLYLRGMKKIIAAILFLLPCSAGASHLIPSPVSDVAHEGRFVLDARTTIRVEGSDLSPLGFYLWEYLPQNSPFGVDPTHNAIVLTTDHRLETEAYRLDVTPERVQITGGGYGGVFNGIQTLLQLLPAEVYGSKLQLPVSLPCRTIEDAPRFAYRGQHLDVARTYVEPEQIKRLIDLLAHHKINKLHWHLTDDEGWRIEIVSHPELAQVGGFRGGDSPIKAIYGGWNEKYGGYYTQAEVRDIVAYAAVRNIEVIPEIDLPGHSRAIARVHPEILCPYTPNLTASNGYDERSAWCVTREENYALLDDILREVASLFPSPYLHIGGDEVEKSEWRPCPGCGKLHDPQHVFMMRVVAILERYGKRPAVWEESIASNRFPHHSRVHGWQGVEPCRRAAAQGYPTVVMPGDYFYFDMRQSPEEDGHNWAAIFDVRKVLTFDFERMGFTPREMTHVEGVEGAFWNELGLPHIDRLRDYIDYMLFPRVCALAELAWTGHGATWESFSRRLDTHNKRMDAMGIFYRPTCSPETPGVRAWEGWVDGEFVTLPIETYRTVTPAVTVTSSMPAEKNTPWERASRYIGGARTTRTCHEGEWVLFTFERPVTCREIFIRTGYVQVPRLIINDGYVETSHDGHTFARVGTLKNGCLKLRDVTNVKAIRIVSTCPDNGSSSVIVQPLRVKA